MVSRINKADGLIEITYAASHLHSLYQKPPLRALFPSDYALGIPSAVLINTAGGVAGGDSLNIHINLKIGAKALITTQSAEKIYSSPVLTSHINTYIHAQKNTWCEWLPHATIIFNGARIKRHTLIDAALDSQVMAGEIIIFGRSNDYELFESAYIHDVWTVRYAEKAIWRDFLYLDEACTKITLENPAGFYGAKAYATLIFVSANAPLYYAVIQEILVNNEVIRSYVNCFENILIIRWLSHDTLVLHTMYCNCWTYLRHLIDNLAKTMPKIWKF